MQKPQVNLMHELIRSIGECRQLEILIHKSTVHKSAFHFFIITSTVNSLSSIMRIERRAAVEK